MRERPQPDPVPSDEPPPHPAEPLQITTPVIDIQNLGHLQPIRVEPTIDSDLREFAREDESALDAILEFEKMLRGQLPG